MRSGNAVTVWSGGVWSVRFWLGGSGPVWQGLVRQGGLGAVRFGAVCFGAVWRGWAVEAL